MDIPIIKRLELLRGELVKRHLEACLIPTADPHQSEYTADCWKFREFVSGFTGSAGTLAVGINGAGLWTDSRYFLQAEEELRGSDIQLFRLGMPGTPNPEDWISGEGFRSVGIDGSVFSAKEVFYLSGFFGQKGIRLETKFEPYETVWTDRPPFPDGEIYLFPEKYCGENIQSKMLRLRNEMSKAGADALPLSALDEIAWVFNLRGGDVDYNPVGICYAFIGEDRAILFANPSKLKKETRTYLQENQVELQPYENMAPFLKNLDKGKILLDKSKINHQLYQSIPDCCTIIEQDSPVSLMKAIKNPVEIAGFRDAMIKDGIALTRFWIWLEKAIMQTSTEALPDEYEIGQKIAGFRKDQDNYVCESFSPIVGFNEHGAIVHYEAEPGTAFKVRNQGLLLIDTGGQYLNGTTDITRTWSFYQKTPEDYSEDYTCLLKGLIALSKASFPAGTRGAQLDVLARQFLWKRGANFFHGTGHGVGHFLNVHEGPQSIRMNENPATLIPGMITSNEPGIYRSGKYGIRLENLILVCEKETTEFGPFLSFETLTLFPFDSGSINKDLLSTDETDWLNNYHQEVYKELAPWLNESEKAWLKKKTQKI